MQIWSTGAASIVLQSYIHYHSYILPLSASLHSKEEASSCSTVFTSTAHHNNIVKCNTKCHTYTNHHSYKSPLLASLHCKKMASSPLQALYLLCITTILQIETIIARLTFTITVIYYLSQLCYTPKKSSGLQP